jgi:hypothetical protein
MNRREFAKATGGSVLICATGVGCAQDYITLRYRLRVVVRVTDRLYEGSTVIEAQIEDRRGAWWLPPEAPGVIVNSWGEAVVIDLNEHGYLFGLLVPPAFQNGFSAERLFGVLASFLPGNLKENAEISVVNLLHLQGEHLLSEKDRPTLVRFRDTSDPLTAELVEADHFQESYGTGAAFERATIAISQDLITRRIEGVLPWLTRGDESQKSKLRIQNPQMTVGQLLTPGNFIRNGE